MMIDLQVVAEFSKQILRDMRQHKLRSALAMFGIVWGTITITLLLALGQGFYLQSLKNMQSYIDGSLIISPGITTKSYQGLPIGRKIPIKADEVMQFIQALPAIKIISPVIRQTTNLVYQKQQTSATLEAVAPEYSQLTSKFPQIGGRFINPIDMQQRAAVIFIGPEVSQKLFVRGEDPVGKLIQIQGRPFTVIGALKKLSDRGSWYNNTAIIPYTTAIELWGDKNISEFVVLAKDKNNIPVLRKQLISYLGFRYHFDTQDKNALSVMDFNQIVEFFTWFFRTVELFLGFCGTLTLAVGGIGLANIMYLIVSERTAEIGLRMAVGARPLQILWQFLLEAAVIVIAGGLLGFLLAWGGLIILQHIPLPQWLGTPQITSGLIGAILLILALIGCAAGFFPARRAARMQPVVALAF